MRNKSYELENAITRKVSKGGPTSKKKPIKWVGKDS